MKKRIHSLFLTALLTLVLAVPVLADGEDAEYAPRFVDNADLVSDEEEAEILEKLDSISEEREMDVVIVTTNDTEGKTVTEYADDYYDYNNYGFGEEQDGILLAVDMGEHNWAISTKGYGITAFTDAGQEYMVEQFKPMLSDGEFADAFLKFADLSDEFIGQAYEGEPYDTSNLPKGKLSFIWLPISLLVGLGLGYFIARMKRSKLKSIKKQPSAKVYTVPGSMQMAYNTDQFINKTVTSRTIERDSGSSTHTSSSGDTHGGSSGSF